MCFRKDHDLILVSEPKVIMKVIRQDVLYCYVCKVILCRFRVLRAQGLVELKKIPLLLSFKSPVFILSFMYKTRHSDARFLIFIIVETRSESNIFHKEVIGRESHLLLLTPNVI